MELLKKLSMKTMGINPKKVIKDLEDGQSVDIIRIAGTAGGVKRGESNFGPWAALLGSFVAIDLQANKPYQAGTAFLPDIVTDMLVKAVEHSDPETGEVTTTDVMIDLTIGLKANEKSSVGYEYTVTPNMKLSSVADKLLENMGYTAADTSKQIENKPETAQKKAGKKGK